MELVKVLGVGVVGLIVASLLKKDKPELMLLAIIATGAMILVIILSSLSSAIAAFADLVARSGLNDTLFGGMLKLVGVGYLTEYAASLATDAGSTSIASKIQLAGKVSIFLMGVPVLTTLVDLLGQLV